MSSGWQSPKDPATQNPGSSVIKVYRESGQATVLFGMSAGNDPIGGVRNVIWV